MGAEFETGDFVRQVQADGKRLVLPRVDKISHTLALHEVADLKDLVAGVWGIREPHITAPLADLATINFILVPGLAFDRNGNRLGYGGGFYDRILQQAMAAPVRVSPSQEPISTRVSGAFAAQIIDAIPIGEHDQPVNLIITENEQIFNHF